MPRLLLPLLLLLLLGELGALLAPRRRRGAPPPPPGPYLTRYLSQQVKQLAAATRCLLCYGLVSCTPNDICVHPLDDSNFS